MPAAEHSIDHLHGTAENPDPRRTIMTLTGHGMQERFEHVYLAAAAALAGITTFFRPLHIHWQLYHPPQPRGPAHLEVSSVAGWWVCVASKWISICSSRSPVEGCDPGSSLGHAHPHGGATTSSASFNGRRGKPFPRARRHGCCSPCTCWPCACCVLTRLVCDALCVRVHDPSVCVLPRSPGRRRGGSKIQKSRVAFIRSFRMRVFCRPLREHVRHRFVSDLCVFGV